MNSQGRMKARRAGHPPFAQMAEIQEYWMRQKYNMKIIHPDERNRNDMTYSGVTGEIEWPSFLISLATRIWPKAGCSSENSKIRAAIPGARSSSLRSASCG
jgi:hypothetical protein